MNKKAVMLIIIALLLGACSLQPIFDGSYFDTPPDYNKLGFYPRGGNLAPTAVISLAPAYDENKIEIAVENSLELNLSYLENNPSKGTWRDFALWAGWMKNKLNDSITSVGTAGDDGASVGWCSYGADPDENVPTWIVYDFGKQVTFQSFGIWPRDDAGTGRGTNLPRTYYAQWSNDGENWVTITGGAADGWNESMGAYTHEDSWPKNFKEQFHYFSTDYTARYFRLYIEEASGSFVQMAELAVYAK